MAITKKSISRIIEKGSAKQRAILILENMADTVGGGKGILSESELERLENSFKTNKEIDTYNFMTHIQKLFSGVYLSAENLSQTYQMSVMRIDSIVTLWLSVNEASTLINSLLSKAAKEDLAKHNELAEWVANFPTNMFGFEIFEEETKDKKVIKWIEPIYDLGGKQKPIIELMKKKAEENLVNAKSFIHAGIDALRELGYKVKGYEDILARIGIEMYAATEGPYKRFTKKGWREWSKKVDGKEVEETEIEEREREGWFFYPEYDETEIDQEQYNSFKLSLMGKVK